MLVTQGLEDIVVSDDPVFTAEYSIPAGAWQEWSLLGIQVKSTSSIEKKHTQDPVTVRERFAEHVRDAGAHT